MRLTGADSGKLTSGSWKTGVPDGSSAAICRKRVRSLVHAARTSARPSIGAVWSYQPSSSTSAAPTPSTTLVGRRPRRRSARRAHVSATVATASKAEEADDHDRPVPRPDVPHAGRGQEEREPADGGGEHDDEQQHPGVAQRATGRVVPPRLVPPADEADDHHDEEQAHADRADDAERLAELRGDRAGVGLDGQAGQQPVAVAVAGREQLLDAQAVGLGLRRVAGDRLGVGAVAEAVPDGGHEVDDDHDADGRGEEHARPQRAPRPTGEGGGHPGGHEQQHAEHGVVRAERAHRGAPGEHQHLALADAQARAREQRRPVRQHGEREQDRQGDEAVAGQQQVLRAAQQVVREERVEQRGDARDDRPDPQQPEHREGHAAR